jgi:SAM-dependent methyltransferase
MTNTLAATREAYTRWAPQYPPLPHNPLMRIEQRLMLEQCPNVAGKSALDLAAGSGRYSRLLAERGAAEVVALDFCAPMLAQVAMAHRVCGSMLQLPFAADLFDLVVAGLALGHTVDANAWMREAARVMRQDGVLLYSDFHPEAARVNLTRSFTDAENRKWTVPHHIHSVDAQLAALAAAGLRLETSCEARVGLELNEAFPGSDEFYARWHGLPIVLIIRASK